MNGLCVAFFSSVSRQLFRKRFGSKSSTRLTGRSFKTALSAGYIWRNFRSNRLPSAWVIEKYKASMSYCAAAFSKKKAFMVLYCSFLVLPWNINKYWTPQLAWTCQVQEGWCLLFLAVRVYGLGWFKYNSKRCWNLPISRQGCLSARVRPGVEIFLWLDGLERTSSRQSHFWHHVSEEAVLISQIWRDEVATFMVLSSVQMQANRVVLTKIA